MNFNNEKIRRFPWGITGGICLIAVFYITAGIIAAYIITNAVAGATNRSSGLFGSWWQTLLFVADVLAVLVCIGSFVMRALTRSASRKGIQGGVE